jgi:hypothetical protein
MSTVSIFEACENMAQKGFLYAAIMSPGQNPFKLMDNARGKLKTSLFKPEYAMYFSPIVDGYLAEDNADQADPTPSKTLIQYEWIMLEEEEEVQEKYSTQDLLFIKLDESKLVSNSSERFAKGGDFRKADKYGWGIHTPDWHKVGMEYGGIHVEKRYITQTCAFNSWLYTAGAIWDPSVVTNIRWFENAGKPWTYF